MKTRFVQPPSHRLLRAGLVLLTIAVWSLSSLVAQINTGKITGIITDSSNASIVRASLRATNAETGVTTTAQTQENGGYLLNFLIPGHYTVEVVSPGFQKSVEKGIEVTAGGTARIDFSLNIGEVQQEVEVQAHPVSVNTESAELTQTFGYKALDQLPNIDRNPLYQMNLLPGANNGGGSGNYGSNGGREWLSDRPDAAATGLGGRGRRQREWGLHRRHIQPRASECLCRSGTSD